MAKSNRAHVDSEGQWLSKAARPLVRIIGIAGSQAVLRVGKCASGWGKVGRLGWSGGGLVWFWREVNREGSMEDKATPAGLSRAGPP
jgi:hypothetical protein